MRTAKEIAEAVIGKNDRWARITKSELIEIVEKERAEMLAAKDAEIERLRERVAELEDHVCFKIREQAEQVAAAKIEGLRRAKEIIGDELLECDEQTGEPIYLHSENCTNYCDYACNKKGEQQAREFKVIFADIDAEIAKMEEGEK